MDHKLRGTGRTTRMLEHAIEQAKEGKQVVVYTGYQHEVSMLATMILGLTSEDTDTRMSGDRLIRPKFAIGAGEITLAVIDTNFDWRLLRGIHLPPEVVSLVDHHPLENSYRAMTNMLYQFMA